MTWTFRLLRASKSSQVRVTTRVNRRVGRVIRDSEGKMKGGSAQSDSVYDNSGTISSHWLCRHAHETDAGSS